MSAVGVLDANGLAPTTVYIPGTDGAGHVGSEALLFNMSSEPVAVSATATNFNDMSTTINVTYFCSNCYHPPPPIGVVGGGGCGRGCSGGAICCGNRCVMNDAQNCGGCGIKCSDTEVCQGKGVSRSVLSRCVRKSDRVVSQTVCLERIAAKLQRPRYVISASAEAAYRMLRCAQRTPVRFAAILMTNACSIQPMARSSADYRIAKGRTVPRSGRNRGGRLAVSPSQNGGSCGGGRFPERGVSATDELIEVAVDDACSGLEQ